MIRSKVIGEWKADDQAKEDLRNLSMFFARDAREGRDTLEKMVNIQVRRHLLTLLIKLRNIE